MTTEPKTESKAEKLARLRAGRDKVAEERAEKLRDREIERLELVERYEQEIGAEGSEFFVYDSGNVDDPLIVVKRGALVQFTKYEDSKHEHTDRYDFVAPSIVRPSLEEYRVLREKRVALEIELVNRLAKLYGLRVEVDKGK